jgi:hypothetical protein
MPRKTKKQKIAKETTQKVFIKTDDENRIQIISGATMESPCWKALVRYGDKAYEKEKEIRIEISSLSMLFANLRASQDKTRRLVQASL